MLQLFSINLKWYFIAKWYCDGVCQGRIWNELIIHKHLLEVYILCLAAWALSTRPISYSRINHGNTRRNILHQVEGNVGSAVINMLSSVPSLIYSLLAYYILAPQK